MQGWAQGRWGTGGNRAKIYSKLKIIAVQRFWDAIFADFQAFPARVAQILGSKSMNSDFHNWFWRGEIGQLFAC
jgi:hypothetical protein